MSKKVAFVASLVTLAAVFLSACATSPTPAPKLEPTVAPTQEVAQGTQGMTIEAQTVAGGSVTVIVKPKSLVANQPLEFEIAMDTHSVDLSYDMLKTVVLRDNSGKEFFPIDWDGAGPGGHHRSGTIKFAPLKISNSITLLVKNVAGVPERVFKWDISPK